MYYPFLSVPANAERRAIEVPITLCRERWEMDFDALEAAVQPDTRLALIANPQNPTGRCYTRHELLELARFAERHDLVICSDEIHCALLLDPEARHIPVASLAPEIGRRTISLFAATKTYNMPGLSCAVAVIPDADLRARFSAAHRGLVPMIGPLAFVAAEAAFNDRSDWVPGLLQYLRENHRLLFETVGARMTAVEGTYLAWIDVRDLGLDKPGKYFEQFGLGLMDGAQFGGPGFVRFNFCLFPGIAGARARPLPAGDGRRQRPPMTMRAIIPRDLAMGGASCCRRIESLRRNRAHSEAARPGRRIGSAARPEMPGPSTANCLPCTPPSNRNRPSRQCLPGVALP